MQIHCFAYGQLRAVLRRRVVLGLVAASLPVLAAAGPSVPAVPLPPFVATPRPPLLLAPKDRVLPDYPPAPLQARIDGHVRLRGRLSPEGSVVDLRCLDCGPDRAGFAAAAMAAIARWSYEPVRGPDGSPLAVTVVFEVRFLP